MLRNAFLWLFVMRNMSIKKTSAFGRHPNKVSIFVTIHPQSAIFIDSGMRHAVPKTAVGLPTQTQGFKKVLLGQGCQRDSTAATI